MKKHEIPKWTYELIVVVVVLCIVGGILWFVSTKDERAANVQFERMVRFANRQQVEIAIIKQAVELRYLRTEIQNAQQSVPQQPFTPDPRGIITE